MKKSGILLVIVGSLVGVGVILSFYGNYVLFEDLSQASGEVYSEQDLVIEKELDKTKIEKGIFAVQIVDSENAEVTANIIDPFNSIIESQTVGQQAHEGLFDVTNSGTYKLLIENRGEPVNVFGVIGPAPDEGKRSLVNISLSILIAGLVGMVLVTVYIVINRRKT